MESESPSIDPRYGPEFQRGYDGTTAPIPLTPTSPADAPIRDAPIRDAPIRDAPIQGEPLPGAAPVVEVPPEAAQSVRRSRNPHLVVIIAAGILSIGVGTWLIVRQSLVDFASNGFSSSSESYRFAQALSHTFAGPLITVGIAALLGVGFFAAARRL